MKKITLYQVDAFTDQPFKGNPAAVCILDKAIDEDLMQAIASEMNLSETAFAVPLEGNKIEKCSNFHLRWFTPRLEVDLCGHATLATAKVLFDVYDIVSNEITFQTKSGVLKVEKKDTIRLDFPQDLTQSVKIPNGLMDAFQIKNIEDCVASERLHMLLIRLKNVDSVINIAPDFNKLAQIEKSYRNHGFIITAKGDGSVDFVSRFFAPGVGINEDPVTGSAHTVLAPYWGKILQKSKMNACQESTRRGFLTLELNKDRVYISGDAIVVMRAELSI